MPSCKLTKSAIDALPLPQKDKGLELWWDESLPGFGVRVGWGGAKTYVLQRRGRRVTIGRHGPWTPDQARERARELTAIALTGSDPPLLTRIEPPEAAR